jgi:hypothetical protein
VEILLGDFNVKVGREDIFEPTFRNESLNEISNNDGVRVVNFATSNILIVKSKMSPHHNVHKCTWTTPDGKTHNKNHHVSTDKEGYSNIVEIQSFRGAGCGIDHYLVVAKFREICQ